MSEFWSKNVMYPRTWPWGTGTPKRDSRPEDSQVLQKEGCRLSVSIRARLAPKKWMNFAFVHSFPFENDTFFSTWYSSFFIVPTWELPGGQEWTGILLGCPSCCSWGLAWGLAQAQICSWPRQPPPLLSSPWFCRTGTNYMMQSQDS